MSYLIELFETALNGSQENYEKFKRAYGNPLIMIESLQAFMDYWENLPPQDTKQYHLLAGYINRDKGAEFRGTAISHFKRAIELGGTIAFRELASIYKNNPVFGEKHPMTISYYQKAIELGNSEAMYELALIYYRNDQMAACIELLDKAISHEHTGAMDRRADMYSAGIGGASNPLAAFNLYLKGYMLSENIAYNKSRLLELIQNNATNDIGIQCIFELVLVCPHLYRKVSIYLPPVSHKVYILFEDANKNNIHYVKYLFLKHHQIIIEAMSKDVYLPIPEQQRFQLFQWLLEKPVLFENFLKNQNPNVLDFLGKHLVAMAVQANVNEQDYNKVSELYKKVPKGSAYYARAQLALAEVTYYEAKDAGADPLMAYQKTKVYLDAALQAAGPDNPDPYIFYKAIASDIQTEDMLLADITPHKFRPF